MISNFGIKSWQSNAFEYFEVGVLKSMGYFLELRFSSFIAVLMNIGVFLVRVCM